MKEETLDSQILLIQERLKNNLALGESHFREFKSALHGPDRKVRRKVSLVAEDIGETLVAFANADGGTLIVGAEDDGTISGLSYAEDDIAVLRDAPKSHVHDGIQTLSPCHRSRFSSSVTSSCRGNTTNSGATAQP